jgi:hypothetical protein
MAADEMSTRVARKRLTLVWFLGAGAVFFIIVAQSVGGKYGDEVTQAWAWFFPTVLPTLALIVSVLVVDATVGAQDKHVDRFLFYLTAGLSGVYLALVLSTILLQPLTGVEPIENMRRSNLWLGPLQGLVTAALGAFFVKGERAHS